MNEGMPNRKEGRKKERRKKDPSNIQIKERKKGRQAERRAGMLAWPPPCETLDTLNERSQLFLGFVICTHDITAQKNTNAHTHEEDAGQKRTISPHRIIRMRIQKGRGAKRGTQRKKKRNKREGQ